MHNTIKFLKVLFPPGSHDRIFLVGGCVRDFLLGRDSKDIDLAAALSPEEVSSLGFRHVEGKSTAPIWFRYDGEFGKIELTLLADAACLAADLAGRDFTINALAISMSGDIIDPLNGRVDLDDQTLRACSPNSFLADPLRIFRALRFEADGWRMVPGTEALIRERDWKQQFSTIPVERYSREMLKALATAGPERFFQRMIEFNIGETYLPEIFRMPAIPAGPLEHHPEGDLFTHSMQVLQRLKERSSDPKARFCAVFHDIGKLATDPALYPKHHGHDQTGFDLARSLCNRLRLPAEYRTALAWTSRLHGTLNRWPELRASTKVRTAEQALKAGIASILLMVSAADKPDGTMPEEWVSAVQIARMTATELGIDIWRLETMPAGKRSGFILQKRVEELRRRQL